MPSPHISSPAKRQFWLSLALLLGMMIAAMHIYGGYTNTPHATNLPPHTPAPTYYYKMLGDAFLAGRTNITPYTLWDVEHYKGKFYLYFGPVPALLIWIPVKLITGIGLSDAAIDWITATIGSCCLFLLMYLIALRQPRADIPGLVICWLAIGFGKWIVPLLYGDIYQAAVTSAYCFDAMAFLFLWLYLDNKNRPVWMVLASLCFGLAAGSRITHVFSGIVLFIVFCHLWKSERYRKPELLRNAWYSFGPFMACLAALAIYNHVRFGSFLDNGVHYQAGPNQFDHRPNFQFFRPDLHLMAQHAYYYLFSLPWYPGMPRPCCDDPQIPFGLWMNHPLSWLFLFWAVDWKSPKGWPQHIRIITVSLIVFALAEFMLLSSYYAASARYEGDFAPWMMCVAVIYYLHLLQQYRNTSYYGLFIGLGGISALYGTFLI